MVILGHYRVREFRAVLIYMLNRLFGVLDHLYRKYKVKIFGRPVLLGRRLDAFDYLPGQGTAPYLNARFFIFLDHRRQKTSRDIPVDQQSLHRVADRWTLHFSVKTYPFRHVQVCVFIDVDMADAFVMFEHGYPLTPGDFLYQALAAPGYDEVHVIA